MKVLKVKAFPIRNLVWRQPEQLPQKSKNVFKFQYVSEKTVKSHLNSLKRNKATGHDQLPPGMLKDTTSVIAKPLCYIINLSLKTGIFPTDWKQAKVSAHHKSGVTSDFSNYRPISILPTLSKIMEKIVHSQLMTHLEENNLLCKSQFGFRANRSTELATTIFLDDIRREVDKGNLVGAIFVDLSKAFDSISHSSLLKNFLRMV